RADHGARSGGVLPGAGRRSISARVGAGEIAGDGPLRPGPIPLRDRPAPSARWTGSRRTQRDVLGSGSREAVRAGRLGADLDFDARGGRGGPALGVEVEDLTGWRRSRRAALDTQQVGLTPE